MPYFDGSAARIYYELEGEGQHTVVLVNGLVMTTAHWLPQRDALLRNFRVLRYDQRCQGRSSVDTDFHYSALVTDLRELFDHCDIARAHLAGISFGSFVAKEFAVRHPRRVGRLVLIATLRELDPQVRSVYAVWRALLRTGELAAFAASVAMLSYDRPWPDVVSEHHAATADKFAARWTGAQVLALLDSFDDRNDLRNHADIVVPTLVIEASRDRIHPPSDSARVAADIAGAEHLAIDGSHAITIDRPEEVNAALLRFFAARER